jgi:hypothetical protein
MHRKRGWMQNERKVEWGPCCFCGSDILNTDLDPCRVTVETQAQKWQVWFCRSSCFKQRLSDRPELMGMFAPAHF